MSSDAVLTRAIEVRHFPLKRLFDILFSSCTLITVAPLFILIALLVASTSKGPILYRHKRIGRGGTPFNCLKFRTMHHDAERRLQLILKSNPTLMAEWLQNHKLKCDPRITPIGKFLRKSSLDELPQFINVIKGDLSVVGPRPVVQDEIIRHFGSKAPKILSIRPGITGLWQTSGRSNISYPARIALDEHYIDNQSMLLDLKLILKTIPSMIKGAY